MPSAVEEGLNKEGKMGIGYAGSHDLLDDREVSEIAAMLGDKHPQEAIQWVLRRFRPERIVVCTSFQAEGMAIADMAWCIDPSIRVATVDTGRLPSETYDLMERVRDRYRLPVEVCYPDAGELSQFAGQHGVNAFYRGVPLRLLCCRIRKVNPLRNLLGGVDAWVTGLRRDQSATRAHTPKIELDREHGGLLKVNPLADWAEDDVWRYIREHDVPYNALYDNGYTSIGCAPCTRAVSEGEDPRAGRWWWEQDAPKECGMHCSLESGSLERRSGALSAPPAWGA